MQSQTITERVGTAANTKYLFGQIHVKRYLRSVEAIMIPHQPEAVDDKGIPLILELTASNDSFCYQGIIPYPFPLNKQILVLKGAENPFILKEKLDIQFKIENVIDIWVITTKAFVNPPKVTVIVRYD